jgi:KDO2-lipid IV(A) lauroyltransferase
MNPRPLKRAKRYLRTLALRVLVAFLGLFPPAIAKSVGARLGSLVFYLAAKERRKALASLSIAFPAWTDAQRAATARMSFVHLGACLAELCCLSRIDPSIDSYVVLPDADRSLLESALAEKKGVVFVSGHVGNFELLARRFSLAGYPCQTIAKETSDPGLSSHIEKVRREGRLKTIWRGRDGAAKEMIRALRRGEILGLLIDQDTGVQGIFVEFFGRMAFTPRAAADLALRTGAAVIVGFIERLPDGRHRISLSRAPIPSQGDVEERVLALTQHLTRDIEGAIRRVPHAWPWIHQRWKTQPPVGGGIEKPSQSAGLAMRG